MATGDATSSPLETAERVRHLISTRFKGDANAFFACLDDCEIQQRAKAPLEFTQVRDWVKKLPSPLHLCACDIPKLVFCHRELAKRNGIPVFNLASVNAGDLTLYNAMEVYKDCTHMIRRLEASRAVSKPQVPRNPAWRCPVEGCAKVFGSMATYKEHYTRLHHSGTAALVCASCSTRFQDRSAYSEHVAGGKCPGKPASLKPPEPT